PFAGEVGGYPKGPLESAKAWMTEDQAVMGKGWRFPDDPDRADQARALGQRGLKIYEMRFSGAQIRSLHEACDVYLTLSHGEGFDMPAFDGKLAGNLMVYCPSGGPQDFAGEHDVLVPYSGELYCHPMYGWPDGSIYDDYSMGDAMSALRRAHELV